MMQTYLDLARAHAGLLAVAIPFFGAALAATVGHGRISWVVASTAAVMAAIVALDFCARTLGGGAPVVAHEGLAIETDGLGVFAIAAIASATAVTALCGQAFFGGAERAAAAFSPALVLVLGGAWSGAVMARDFTTLLVFVEIAWLASIGLVALSSYRSRGALNGALRMTTFGGVAAALFLLGVALAERALGSATIATIASQRIVAPNMAAVGVTLMLAALVCKAGLTPMNAWAATTYGKASGFAMLAVGAVGGSGAMFALAHVATAALAAPAIGAGIGLALSVFGVLSAIMGSVQAIGAGNIWRLSAYSAAAQMGCVVLAIALGSPAGFEAALIQTIALSASLVALVGGAVLSGVDASMTSLDGLGRRAPLAGIVMTAGALSLMGAPLTLSFLGRWRLVEAALGIGWWWVAAAAIVLSLAGSYYGGRLIERIYFRHATHSPAEASGLRWKAALAPALLAAFVTIVSAVEPTWLLHAASTASQMLMDRAQ
ncbi:MAG: proton-conducting transporter membrane subunit [Vitreimonas sp.]